MNRLHNLLCSLALTVFVSPVFAGGNGSGQIAIYAGTEKFSSTGGGTSNSGGGEATGKRRQPVFIVIDGATGEVQRIALNSKARTYKVESAATFQQVFVKTEKPARNPREYVRLMLLSDTQPQPGEVVKISSQYDGRTLDSLVSSLGLVRAYPRVLKWQFEFLDSEYVTGVPAVTNYAQIDSGTALLSINRILTETANATDMTLADAIILVQGTLAKRKYTPEAP